MAPCISRNWAAQQNSMTSARPKCEEMPLNLRKPKMLSEMPKETAPTAMNQQEQGVVLLQRLMDRMFMSSSTKQYETNRMRLGNLSHRECTLVTNMMIRTTDTPFLASLFAREDSRTWSPMQKARQQRRWAIRKNPVPIMNAEISSTISSTSPIRDRARPPLTRVGTRWSRWEFLPEMQMIMRTMGRGLMRRSGKQSTSSPMSQRAMEMRMQRLRRGYSLYLLFSLARRWESFFLLTEVVELMEDMVMITNNGDNGSDGNDCKQWDNGRDAE